MVKNNDGEVKCLTKDGQIRWLAEHIAVDEMLMKSIELMVAPSPIKIEPKIIPTDEAVEMLGNVAEAVVADKPRKNKTK